MDEVTRIRYKKLAGETLSQEEQGLLTGYYRRYNPCRITFHTKVATRATWADAARHQGLSLSSWIAQQVERSQLPVTPEVEAAKAEAQAARDQVVALRKTIAELSIENGALNDQLRGLETSLAAAVNSFPAILEALQDPARRGARA